MQKNQIEWAGMPPRDIVLDWLSPKLSVVGLDIADIGENQDLYELGAVDSFDIVEFVATVEEATDLKANFDAFSDTRFVLSISTLSRLFQ